MKTLDGSEDLTIIIILQMCQTKNFQGQIRVSNTFHVTKVIINEDIREINESRNTYKKR